MKILNLLSSLFLIILCSCSSVASFKTDTFRPAQALLPAINNKIVLVDNAAVQPDSLGAYIYDLNNSIDTIHVAKDTLKSLLISYLADQLYLSGFFQDVVIYNIPMKSNNNWTSLTELSGKQQDSIYNQTDANWILSLDFISTLLDIKVSRIADNIFLNSKMTLQTQSLYSLYSRGSTKYQKRFLIPDTISWNTYGYDIQTSIAQLPHIEDALNEGVYWNADKSSKTWIPYRQTEDRVFIRSSEPAMREAEYLRLKGKLEDASYMWEYVYENNSKNRLKV